MRCTRRSSGPPRRVSGRRGEMVNGMGSLVNMVLGAGVAVVVVLAFWLIVGFIDDTQQR